VIGHGPRIGQRQRNAPTYAQKSESYYCFFPNSVLSKTILEHADGLRCSRRHRSRVQARSIGAFEGRDVIGLAQTGTARPQALRAILNRLAPGKPAAPRRPARLILSATR